VNQFVIVNFQKKVFGTQAIAFEKEVMLKEKLRKWWSVFS